MRFYPTFIFIVFCFNASVNVFSQKSDEELQSFIASASIKTLIEENSYLILNRNFRQSEMVADKLLEIDPESANYNYRKGIGILNSSTNRYEATKYFEKAILSTAANFDFFSQKELNAPIDSYFYLARSYHLNAEIEKAVKYYQQYLDESGKNAPLENETKLCLKQCEVAKDAIQFPKDFEVLNLGKIINSVDPEYAPVVSLDGQSLYFTSRRLRSDSSNADIIDPLTNMYLEDIFVSVKNDQRRWTNPKMLEFCQAETNEATVAVSTDERNVYVYKDDAGNGDIFYSEFQDGRFKDLQPILDNGINTESWEPHITVAIDGNSKYFSSNREGGFGGRDIYRIVKLPNGEWSEPYNLGPTINTPYDEDSPFIAGDNKTMYYSSNGPQSMGGFDVFLTILYETDDFTGWSYPINLGYPLNSTGDDIYYTTTADGKTGYISSYRLGGEGDKDIYEIRNDFMGNQNISFLNGEIIIIPDNASFPEDIQVTLECKNCDQKSIQTLIPRMRDGKFFSTLQKCSDYELTYTLGPEKTVFYTSTIKTNCEDNFEEINECVILDLNDKKGRPVLQYEIVGGVADIETKQMLENAKVEILDESGNLLESLSTNSNGTFTSKLAKGKTYGESMNLNIRVSKDKYVTQQFNAKVLFKDDRKIKLDYYIDKLEVGKDLGKILALNPIYFDLDKSDIRPDAEIELNKIVQIMNDNPEIKIELGSHTDCRATASYNLKLSDARAKSSAAYIQSKITNPNRIYGKGYGETQLVNDCECEGKIKSDCSEEEHQENRRTEFKIVK